jgi:hypothetical protein
MSKTSCHSKLASAMLPAVPRPRRAVSWFLLALAGCAATEPRSVLPEGPGLTVGGALSRSGWLSLGELEALGPEDVTWTFRDESHVYRGIRLDKLLISLGFDAGMGGPAVPPRERRPGWRNVVVASATGGVCCVFTCAELMPEMGPTRAFVVWSRDGAPLPGDEGPLRLVVVTDQKGHRSARQLIDLRVIEMKSDLAGGR